MAACCLSCSCMQKAERAQRSAISRPRGHQNVGSGLAPRAPTNKRARGARTGRFRTHKPIDRGCSGLIDARAIHRYTRERASERNCTSNFVFPYLFCSPPRRVDDVDTPTSRALWSRSSELIAASAARERTIYFCSHLSAARAILCLRPLRALYVGARDAIIRRRLPRDFVEIKFKVPCCAAFVSWQQFPNCVDLICSEADVKLCNFMQNFVHTSYFSCQ